MQEMSVYLDKGMSQSVNRHLFQNEDHKKLKIKLLARSYKVMAK